MAEAEEELRKVRDQLEITDVINRYGRGVYEEHLDLLVSCFADDAHLDYGAVQMDGIDEVREFFGRTIAPPKGITRKVPGLDVKLVSTPMMTNVMIELDGDRAHAESSCLAVHVGTRGESELVTVRGTTNTDDLIRTPSGWKIRARVHTALWTFETPGTVVHGH